MTGSLQSVIKEIRAIQDSLVTLSKNHDSEVYMAEWKGLEKAVDILERRYGKCPLDTLKDVLPREAIIHDNVSRFADEDVIETVDSSDREWPGKRHKNVSVWYILGNGKAIGWNNNPVTGWSFPVINY